MGVSEAIRQELIQYILLQVYNDQYIDRLEEKKILEACVKKGVTVEEGLALIHQVANEKDLVVERVVEERAKELLQQFALNDGVIDKKEFEDAFSLFKLACKGKVPDPLLKKRLKQMVLENGWKVKEGGLFGSKWFSTIPS